MSTGGQAVEHARRADTVAASVPPPRAVRQAERQTDDAGGWAEANTPAVRSSICHLSEPAEHFLLCSVASASLLDYSYVRPCIFPRRSLLRSSEKYPESQAVRLKQNVHI
jgi:hypothetical protein